MLFEICVDGLDQALKASDLGADRIEFCQQLEVGGITPKFEDLEQYLTQKSTKVVVMVRHRPGDFVYDHQEI